MDLGSAVIEPRRDVGSVFLSEVHRLHAADPTIRLPVCVAISPSLLDFRLMLGRIDSEFAKEQHFLEPFDLPDQ